MKKLISDEEIKSLLGGLTLHGEEDLYAKMRSKAFFVMGQVEDVDEMFLDMSDEIVEKAREIEDENIQRDYRTIAYVMRRVAHAVYRKYIKQGEPRQNERFLRVVK